MDKAEHSKVIWHTKNVPMRFSEGALIVQVSITLDDLCDIVYDLPDEQIIALFEEVLANTPVVANKIKTKLEEW